MRPLEPRIVSFGELKGFLVGVGLAAQGGVNVDVVTSLTT
jgi:hypothetical protein